MTHKKPLIILFTFLLVMSAFSGVQGNDVDCDGLVIDVTTRKPKTEEEGSADFYVVAEKNFQAYPGDILKVFRPVNVSGNSGEAHQLKIYIGRLETIDVQDEVLIGRLIEFAPRQQYPRVRYETVMIGDCLTREPPSEPADVVPEEFGAEAIEVAPMEIPAGAEMPADRRVIPSKILFAFDRADIQDRWSDELEQLARFIALQAPAKVLVEGHADWIGTDAYNVKLSRRRAQAVVDYLVSKHRLDREIFETKAYGESRPEASNQTAEGRQKNRRAAVTVLLEVIPTTETVFIPETEWPLAVSPARLSPEEAEIPRIPREPGRAEPPGKGP